MFEPVKTLTQVAGNYTYILGILEALKNIRTLTIIRQ
jgi:hypothetical protein